MSLREDIERVENKMKKIEEESLAMELLKFSKEQNSQLEKINKRLIIVLIIILVFWFATIGYLVYILNDIGSYTEETSQEVSDVDTINGSVVNKGDIYGEDKANSN